LHIVDTKWIVPADNDVPTEPGVPSVQPPRVLVLLRPNEILKPNATINLRYGQADGIQREGSVDFSNAEIVRIGTAQRFTETGFRGGPAGVVLLGGEDPVDFVSLTATSGETSWVEVQEAGDIVLPSPGLTAARAAMDPTIVPVLPQLKVFRNIDQIARAIAHDESSRDLFGVVRDAARSSEPGAALDDEILHEALYGDNERYLSLLVKAGVVSEAVRRRGQPLPEQMEGLARMAIVAATLRSESANGELMGLGARYLSHYVVAALDYPGDYLALATRDFGKGSVQYWSDWQAKNTPQEKQPATAVAQRRDRAPEVAPTFRQELRLVTPPDAMKQEPGVRLLDRLSVPVSATVRLPIERRSIIGPDGPVFVHVATSGPLDMPGTAAFFEVSGVPAFAGNVYPVNSLALQAARAEAETRGEHVELALPMPDLETLHGRAAGEEFEHAVRGVARALFDAIPEHVIIDDAAQREAADMRTAGRRELRKVPHVDADVAFRALQDHGSALVDTGLIDEGALRDAKRPEDLPPSAAFLGQAIILRSAQLGAEGAERRALAEKLGDTILGYTYLRLSGEAEEFTLPGAPDPGLVETRNIFERARDGVISPLLIKGAAVDDVAGAAYLAPFEQRDGSWKPDVGLSI
jgi:hypothetical protein